MAIFLLCPQIVEGTKELSGGLFGKGTNPKHRTLPKEPVTSQTPYFISTTLGFRFPTFEFGVDANIQSLAEMLDCYGRRFHQMLYFLQVMAKEGKKPSK